MFRGEPYEYNIINESSVKKFNKLVALFPAKDRIEFFEINRCKIESIRQAKIVLVALNENFPNLRYLNIQQCSLCINFVLQFKTFISKNTSLIRLTLTMNKMYEQDCYSSLLVCLDHPLMEVFQLTERMRKPEDNEKNPEKSQLHDKDLNQISICRGV